MLTHYQCVITDALFFLYRAVHDFNMTTNGKAPFNLCAAGRVPCHNCKPLSDYTFSTGTHVKACCQDWHHSQIHLLIKHRTT